MTLHYLKPLDSIKNKGIILLKSQPVIAVQNVEASSHWYQKLFNCESGHGGKEYERLTIGEEFFLQLHKWNEHDHPNLDDRYKAPNGHGVLLWFQVDDFDDTFRRAKSLHAKIIDGPKVNERANHRECWLYDLDHYVVVFASKYGDL